MITHEQARHFNKNPKSPYIDDYITQQEKKDKLLELYRNLSMETDVLERSRYWERINEIEREL